MPYSVQSNVRSKKVNYGILRKLSRLVIVLVVITGFCAVGVRFLPKIRSNQLLRQEVYQLEQEITSEKAAAKHADDLFKNSRFSHMGNDGSEASDRVEKAGYKWSAVGENIGKGYATAAQVVNGWRQSPGHCRNMMDPSFREIGAARKGEIWVLNLGAWRE